MVEPTLTVPTTEVVTPLKVSVVPIETTLGKFPGESPGRTNASVISSPTLILA